MAGAAAPHSRPVMVCLLQLASEGVRTCAISCRKGIRAAPGSMDTIWGGATGGVAVSAAAAAAGAKCRAQAPALTLPRNA